ncbi:hypothetical protein ACFE04_005000 [Oxalis oulophora]
MASIDIGFLVRFANRAAYASISCIVALGGAIIGTIMGAMKGQTTETGFVRGAGVGALTGAITAIQLVESVALGESWTSKVALLYSIVNGRVFIEWVTPALMKAYQWQIGGLEISPYTEVSDIYDVDGIRGLPQKSIEKLPQCNIQLSNNNSTLDCHEHCCSICLQDMKDGEIGRELPSCGHVFHLECLDKWLIRNASCPLCRVSVLLESEYGCNLI